MAMQNSEGITAVEEEEENSLEPTVAQLDPGVTMVPQGGTLVPLEYDSEAFDSMAVINSEVWKEEGPDEGGLTRGDLAPQGVAGLSEAEVGDLFLKAGQSGVLDVLRELHEARGPAILGETDEDGYTALHRASYNGHVDIVEYLIGAGARVDARTADGWQPLHCACRWNKVGVASLLLQNGASVNAQTDGGQTPLHLAASNDRAAAVLELLLRQRGLEAGRRNGQDETALDVARRSGCHTHLFELAEESVDHWRFLKKRAS